jgi:hypothetical protein
MKPLMILIEGSKEIETKAVHDLNTVSEISFNVEPGSNVIRLIVSLCHHSRPRTWTPPEMQAESRSVEKTSVETIRVYSGR